MNVITRRDKYILFSRGKGNTLIDSDSLLNGECWIHIYILLSMEFAPYRIQKTNMTCKLHVWLRKGWPFGSRLWCLIAKLSLSHWYPGSGVVLNCIDSWSLPSFLLLFSLQVKIFYWPFQGGASFVDHFCHLCFVFVMLSCLPIAAFWSPAGKGAKG